MFTEGSKLAGPSEYLRRQGTQAWRPPFQTGPRAKGQTTLSVKMLVATFPPMVTSQLPSAPLELLNSAPSKNLVPVLLALTWLRNNHAP